MTHEEALIERLVSQLEPLTDVTVIGPAPGAPRVGVISLVSATFEPHVLATVLDESFGIQVRAGLHCAPGVHRAAGTFDDGGTVRLSVGPFSTTEEIDEACEALASVTSS